MNESNFDPFVQKLCIYSGSIAVFSFFFAFFVAGFIPPPGPWLTEAEVAALYQDHTTQIRIGMVVMMIGSMFAGPFYGIISHHMRRIEKGSRVLTYTQLASGTSGIFTFCLPGVLFCITAFRPDRPSELIYLMNDFTWVLTFMIWPPFFMQNLAIGTAILRDRSSNPVFPRWFGFYQFWAATLYISGTFLPFVKSGPFAWNGLMTFWVAAADFVLWFIVTTVMLLKATEHERREVAAAQH